MSWLRQLRQFWHNAHSDLEGFDREQSRRERLEFRWERVRLERRRQIVEAQVRARRAR